jgi:hypothetical protein
MEWISMTSVIRNTLFLLLLGIMASGCEQDGPMERAGKVVDEAIEDTGEALEDAQETVEDAIEEQQKNN